MIVPMHVPKYVVDEVTGDWYLNPAYQAQEDFLWGDPYDAFVEELLLLKDDEFFPSTEG